MNSHKNSLLDQRWSGYGTFNPDDNADDNPRARKSVAMALLIQVGVVCVLAM